MKFQKGLLDEKGDAKSAVRAQQSVGEQVDKRSAVHESATRGPSVVDKDRLFDTVSETRRSGRKYVAALLVVCIVVGAAASAVWYAMRPGSGDRVTAPRGLELALRDHFLAKEKRVATDIAFYLCDGFYWARVGVETRTDIPNPLFRVDTYAASARQVSESWSITATPVKAPEGPVPCL